MTCLEKDIKTWKGWGVWVSDILNSQSLPPGFLTPSSTLVLPDCRIIITEIFILKSGVGIARLHDWLLWESHQTWMLWRQLRFSQRHWTYPWPAGIHSCGRKDNISLQRPVNNELCIANTKSIHEIECSARGTLNIRNLTNPVVPFRALHASPYQRWTWLVEIERGA